jgi:hypothetical protein
MPVAARRPLTRIQCLVDGNAGRNLISRPSLFSTRGHRRLRRRAAPSTATRSAWTIVTRAACDRSPNDHPGNPSRGQSTAEIHAGRGRAAPEETTDGAYSWWFLTDRKRSDIKGLASARTASFARWGSHGRDFTYPVWEIGRPPLLVDFQRPKRIFVICITD